jgi:hypothetical protein
MNKETDAESYRLRQAEKMLELFAEANGREAASIEELQEWMASPGGRAATAYDRDEEGKIIP